MEGFYNRLLRVNLSNRSYRTEEIPDRIFERYLGGKGLGTYLLLNQQKGIDPLSPENQLIFALGPANGVQIFGSSRFGVYTKSPLTGIYAESYSGGSVADPMSRTGFDAFVLEGSSKDPVFIEISDKGANFYDASDLWGKDTYTTEDKVLKRIGVKGAAAVVIGPAGENLVRFAVIENNYWRSAGRTGVGAVMGSKKVKGIVFHGTQRKKVAHGDLLIKFWEEWKIKGKDHPSAKAFKNFGTPLLVSMVNHVGGFPTRYWYEGTFEGWEKISAEALVEKCLVKPKACASCFLACGRLSEVLGGRYKGLRIEGPEYETIYAFGGLCLIGEIEEIVYLNDLCDRLGMDTISAGNLAAFAIEASRRSKIDERLDYGDVDQIAELLNKIAKRESIGETLAQGIRYAAKQWGMEDIAIHVKGMEPAGYDPRIFKGMALAYATSDRGACHLRSTFFRAELSGMIPMDQIEEKAKLFLDFEDRLTLQDALVICRFYRDLYLWDGLKTIIKGTTGMDLDENGLKKIASNITNLTRRFNLREGITQKDDTLPKRLLEEKIDGKGITADDLNRLIQDYYYLRGWSKEGVPLGE